MRAGGELTIVRGLDELPEGFGPCAATVGVFDGVHLGHQALMRRVVEASAEENLMPIVVTFDRHPLEVVAPAKQPALLTTLEQRATCMAALGIRAMVVLTFDDSFRRLEPHEFVRQVLVEALDCRRVVVGSNFRFGYKHAGTIETLADLAIAEGFELEVFAFVQGADRQVISSSLIRRQLADGEVERVAEELARPWALAGVVERGAGRGRGLGVPTANIEVSPRGALPKLGVYAGWLVVDDARHMAAINVGVNPTFGDRTQPVVEVHALDFDGDLYGRAVEVEFTHRLRDERRFDDVDELIRQMQIDITQVRELLAGRRSAARTRSG